MEKIGKMAIFGNSNNVDANGAYKVSFGNMPEGVVYAGGVNPTSYKSNDRREILKNKQSELIQKELTSSSNEYASGTLYSTTSGNLPVLIPIYVDTQIVDLVRKETPVYDMLPKRAVRGKTYDYNQLSGLNSAGFLAEGAALNESDDTFTRQSVQIKLAYSIGKVTGFAQAAGAGYIDMLREQVQTHTRSLVQLLEDTVFNGDATTNPNEFDGLIQLITTNTDNKAAAALTLSDIRDMIRNARAGGFTAGLANGGGNPNLIVCDMATYDVIKGLMTSYLRYTPPTTTIGFGIQTYEFEGIPVMYTKFLDTTSGSRRLFVLDTSVLFMATLQDITYQDLAMTSDSNKFMLKYYGSLVLQAEQFCGMIYGIA
jgi:hypothetical protein